MPSTLIDLRAVLLAHWASVPLLLTLAAYVAGVELHRISGRSPLLNPTLVAIAVVVATLLLLHLDYRSYFAAAQPLHMLLGPAVVALAVPLYRHLGLIRRRAVALLIALAGGSLSGILSSVMVGWWLGVSHADLLSLAPKSATTAVSMAVSAQIGGLPATTAVLTILAGITGATLAGYLLDRMRIYDPAARGFAIGLGAHGIGTARAFQESETAGTFAGLAMGLNAIATSMLAPLLVHFLAR